MLTPYLILYGRGQNSMKVTAKPTCRMRISPTEPVTAVYWRGQAPFYPIEFDLFRMRADGQCDAPCPLAVDPCVKVMSFPIALQILTGKSKSNFRLAQAIVPGSAVADAEQVAMIL